MHHAGGPASDGSAATGGLISNGTAKFDLTAVIVETGGRAQGYLEYNTDLFDRETIETLVSRFVTLLGSIARNPEAALCALPLGAEPESETDTEEAESAARGSIPAWVAAHAADRPEAAAFVQGDSTVTWAQFARAVARRAGDLAAGGVRRGDRVAVRVTQTAALAAAQAAAMVGAQHLGAVCVPLDAAEPQRRLASMLADADAKAVLDPSREAMRDGGHEPAAVAAGVDDPACIVYRSGPHGQPVGVALSHGQLSRSRLSGPVRIEASDRVAWHASFARDAGIHELFGALAAGATVVGLDGRLAPIKFARALRDQAVTVCFATPDLLRRLAEEFPWSLRGLRLILTVADGLSGLAHLRGALGSGALARVFVLGGWTEAGGACAHLPLEQLSDQAPALPLGYALPGVRLDVLADDGRRALPGTVGEVAVRGVRTGDYAIRRADGYVELRSRRDDRVVLAGMRAEAAEAEAALLRHPKVAAAAVVAARSPDTAELVAFVAGRGGEAPDRAELQGVFADWLPAELIPAAVHTMDALPLTPGGEIDRAALRIAAVARRAAAADVRYVAPRNAVETELASLWTQTLGDVRIGVHDNFFSLGGHSLLATQLVSRMSDHFQLDIPLRRLFEKPTIAELAEDIAKMALAPAPAEYRAIRSVPRDRPLPLSFAQQRLWFLDHYQPGSPLYNMPNATRMRGPLDARVLHAAINALIARHESLRTTFTSIEDGEGAQIVHSVLTLDMPVHDLGHLAGAERERQTQALVEREAQLPFDLAAGPLIRAQLVRLDDDDHVLLLTLHHIVADGRSMEILFGELNAIYAALSVGQEPALSDLPLQYADFACWQREWLTGPVLAAQLDYWKRQLAGAPPLLDLPTDHRRPRVQVFRGGLHTFALPLSLAARLRALSEREGVTLFMVLLAGFKAMLHRYTGEDDLVVGTPIANRMRPELDGLIGFFANTLVLRTQLTADMTFRQLLRAVSQTATGAYAIRTCRSRSWWRRSRPSATSPTIRSSR